MTQKADFNKALDFVLANEGGFSNDPEDSGGATNFGITHAELSLWVGHNTSVDDVKNMTKDVAKAIYAKNYWNPLNLDQIESTRVATVIFDQGVNGGLMKAGEWAQICCNVIDQANLEVDGQIGPKTADALNRVYTVQFIQTFSALSWAYYIRRVVEAPSQKVFLNGWIARAKRYLTLLPEGIFVSKSGDLI